MDSAVPSCVHFTNPSLAGGLHHSYLLATNTPMPLVLLVATILPRWCLRLSWASNPFLPNRQGQEKPHFLQLPNWVLAMWSPAISVLNLKILH